MVRIEYIDGNWCTKHQIVVPKKDAGYKITILNKSGYTIEKVTELK